MEASVWQWSPRWIGFLKNWNFAFMGTVFFVLSLPLPSLVSWLYSLQLCSDLLWSALGCFSSLPSLGSSSLRTCSSRWLPLMLSSFSLVCRFPLVYIDIVCIIHTCGGELFWQLHGNLLFTCTKHTCISHLIMTLWGFHYNKYIYICICARYWHCAFMNLHVHVHCLVYNTYMYMYMYMYMCVYVYVHVHVRTFTSVCVKFLLPWSIPVIGVYGDILRVKILYNKRDSALIQFKEPQHAQTGMI